MQKAGNKNVAMIDDKQDLRRGPRRPAFTQEFKKLGGTVVARETVGQKDTDFSGVIGKVGRATRTPSTTAVSTRLAGPLSKQLAGAGLNVPLMGGDGIFDAKFVQLAAARRR